ncbi:hypothetical protein NDU88_005024 [Pleurodeles waltl]|uniref:Uncharacterized protein n=1 Tax=Pleurodeles waltl TaxID=8319 RepID=A0AAV7SKH6_PLEWA|nr:hypothetical protein NDU88_005024 [Pleurodeles waltl]
MGDQIKDMTLLEDRVLTEPLPEQAISTIYKKLTNTPNPNKLLSVACEEDMVKDFGTVTTLAIWARFRLRVNCSMRQEQREPEVTALEEEDGERQE